MFCTAPEPTAATATVATNQIVAFLNMAVILLLRRVINPMYASESSFWNYETRCLMSPWSGFKRTVASAKIRGQVSFRSLEPVPAVSRMSLDLERMFRRFQ